MWFNNLAEALRGMGVGGIFLCGLFVGELPSIGFYQHWTLLTFSSPGVSSTAIWFHGLNDSHWFHLWRLARILNRGNISFVWCSSRLSIR